MRVVKRPNQLPKKSRRVHKSHPIVTFSGKPSRFLRLIQYGPQVGAYIHTKVGKGDLSRGATLTRTNANTSTTRFTDVYHPTTLHSPLFTRIVSPKQLVTQQLITWPLVTRAMYIPHCISGWQVVRKQTVWETNCAGDKWSGDKMRVKSRGWQVVGW